MCTGAVPGAQPGCQPGPYCRSLPSGGIQLPQIREGVPLASFTRSLAVQDPGRARMSSTGCCASRIRVQIGNEWITLSYGGPWPEGQWDTLPVGSASQAPTQSTAIQALSECYRVLSEPYPLLSGSHPGHIRVTSVAIRVTSVCYPGNIRVTSGSHPSVSRTAPSAIRVLSGCCPGTIRVPSGYLAGCYPGAIWTGCCLGILA